MKRSLSITLITFFGIAVAQSRTAQASSDWEVVHDYISEHAVFAPSQVEGALYLESINGEKSWDVVAGSTQVTGFGPGWPAPNQSIVMPTLEEANQLAGLIDAFRERQ